MSNKFFFLLAASLVVVSLTLSARPFPCRPNLRFAGRSHSGTRGIADDTNPPILVADQNRTVHAFYSQWTTGNFAIFYNQWTPTTGWTAPVDVILSPYKQQATVLGAVLDSKGMFHVIFFGGIAQGAQIYYTSALAVNAGQAHAWSTPIMIGDRATSPASGALVGDGKGNLFVLYTGNRDGDGIYEVHSADDGATWSDPTSIFLTGSSGQSACCLQTHLGEQGWLHAIWLVVSTNGQGRATYYARSNLRERQWSLPTALAQTPSGLGVRSPAITEHQGIVFAAFYDADLAGHYVMRISSDEGQTWNDTITPFPKHVGANGAGAFVVDAKNDLHLFFGERITGAPGYPDIHGMWHSVWQGDNRWSDPEAIVSGPLTAEFDPIQPQSAVSQGNVLLVTWRNDYPLVPTGIWYAYAALDSPELALVPLPTPALTFTATPSETATSESATPTGTAVPKSGIALQAGGSGPGFLVSNPNMGILLAILPALLILSAVVLVRSLRGAV